MAVWRFWVIIIGLVFLFADSCAYSETVPELLLEEIVSPIVEPIKPAQDNFFQGEVLTYQVHVRWPKLQEAARLDSPEITTENLKFIGVSQEMVTEVSSFNLQEETLQVLSFKFATQKPGLAKINRFSLRWTFAQGAASTSITVPGLEFKIKRSVLTVLKTPVLLISMGALLLSISLFFLRIRRKKQANPNISSENLLEEVALKELQKAKSDGEVKGRERDFLGRLNHIFYRYLEQKLDWNPAKGSYNEIQKTIENKWSKKEASELKELIDQFEYLRFSESKKNPTTAEELCNTVSSFIERRKIN
jgi:hypothetical protein